MAILFWYFKNLKNTHWNPHFPFLLFWLQETHSSNLLCFTPTDNFKSGEWSKDRKMNSDDTSLIKKILSKTGCFTPSHQPPHRSSLSMSSCLNDNASLSRIRTCARLELGSKAPDGDYKQAAFLLYFRAGDRWFIGQIISIGKNPERFNTLCTQTSDLSKLCAQTVTQRCYLYSNISRWMDGQTGRMKRQKTNVEEDATYLWSVQFSPPHRRLHHHS